MKGGLCLCIGLSQIMMVCFYYSYISEIIPSKISSYCSNGCYAVVDLLSWWQLVLLGLKSHDCKLSILKVISLIKHQLHEVANNMLITKHKNITSWIPLTLTVLVTTIDAQWEGMGDVGSARLWAGTTSPKPDHKVNFQKVSTLRVI